MTCHIGAKRLEGRTRNLSRGGMCLTVPTAVALGVDLTVELELVFDDDMRSEAMRLPARVAWCTTLDDAYQLGVAFRPLEPEQAEMLGVFLRFLDDARPERRARDLSIDDRFG